jgi:hypothetical protein
LASLGDGLPSAEGHRGRLVPLLSSIASKPRARKGNPKQTKGRMRDDHPCKAKGIFIVVKCRTAIVMSVVSVPALAIKCIISRTMHRAPVI